MAASVTAIRQGIVQEAKAGLAFVLQVLDGFLAAISQFLGYDRPQQFAAFLDEIDTYCRNYSMGCTRTTTELPFDELILRMMRATALSA